MVALTEKQAALFRGENFAVLATVRPDGTPHVTPVWVDYDGEHVLFNTVRGNAKERYLGRDPNVTLTVWDAENPYEYVEVLGTAEVVAGGGTEHIHALSRKYTGSDYADLQEGEERVTVKVTPTKVQGLK